MQDVVAELRVGVKDLAAEDRAGWMPLALSDRVRDLVGLSEATQIEVVRALAAWDRATAWAEDGAVTAASWLCANLTITGAEATGLVRVARLYDQHACVADALDHGDLSLAHARILARAERNREAPFADCVDGLVSLAKETSGLKDYGQVIAEWIELVDDHAPKDDTKRRLNSSDTIGGMAHTDLFGSADDAAIIRAAIEALDTPDPADCAEGPRSRQQRHYDIAIDIFRRALADQLGDDPQTPGNADVIVDADTAAELLADPDPARLGPDDLDGFNPLVDLLTPYRDHSVGEQLLRRHCTYADGSPARRTVAAVMLCSGWVRRIIRDPHTGNVLDVGRAHRRFTPRQRRALVIRDGGCVFPGCDRKPKWCDAHHLRPWEDDGLTNLDNGVLLCRRHHTFIHHNGWTLERDVGTGTVTTRSPDAREFTRRPGQARGSPDDHEPG
jgi:hypothetical protein